MPELQSLADDIHGADLVTVLVGNNPDHARAVARARGLRAPVLLDDGRLRRAFGVSQTPTTILLDDTGHAYDLFLGAVGRDRIASAVRDRLQ